MTTPAPERHPVEVRFIGADEALPLRAAVLRPGRPIELAKFPGDDLPTTKHFGAFRNGRLLGIASVFLAEMPGHTGLAALQLRGMATAPEVRGEGFGRTLVRACVEFARDNGAEILWCNARTSAIEFYRKLGWEILGEEFNIPDVGPHFRMWLRLD